MHSVCTGAMEGRRRDIIEMRVLKTAEDIIRKDFKGNRDQLAGLIDQVMTRDMAPREAAERLLESFKKA